MSKDKRLDPKVIEEAQNYKDHLDNLDIKSLWEELDKLVPEDQTHKTHTQPSPDNLPLPLLTEWTPGE